MKRIRKGDKVVVISGGSVGVTGEVIDILPKKKKDKS